MTAGRADAHACLLLRQMTEMTPEKESKSNTPPKALVSSSSLSSPPHCCLLDVDVDVLIVSTHSTSTSTSTSTDTDVDVLAIKDVLPVTSKERAVLMENEPAPPARARQRKTSKVLLDIIYPHCPVAPEEKGLLGAAEDPEAAKDWAVLDNSTLAHSAGAGAVVALSPAVSADAEQQGGGSLLLAAVLWVLIICCTQAFAELRWADIDEAGMATVEVEQHAGGATCTGMKVATQRIAQLEALATAAGLDVPPENVVYASQAPQHRQLFEGSFGDMSSPTAGLSESYFLLYTSCVMWVGVVSVGLGSEAVFGTFMVRLISNADGSQRSAGGVVGGQRLWQMAQLLFSLNILVAFFSRSALGLPFLVLGLWKLGFPETLISLQLAGQRAMPASMRAFHFIDGLATLLHHTSTAFIIVASTTGLFPHSRALVAPCVVPIVQHMICLLKYVAPRTHTLLMLLTEVYFEWEVFGNLPHMHSPHGAPFSRIGRAVATDMLVSHWLYMVAAIIKLVAPYFYSTWGPAEAAGEVAQYGNEAVASRTDSRLSHGSQATSVATSVATSAASTSPVSVLSAGAELMELGMVRHGMSRKSSFKVPC